MRSSTSISRAAAITALVAGACVTAYPFAAARADDPQQRSAPSGAVAGTIVTAEATVKKIDTTRGTITLATPRGRTFEVKAGPDVDLERLHTGDTVTASYYEEIAVAIDPAKKPATQLTEKTVVRGGVAERQATVTARIVSVDAKKNSVVVATPDGNKHTLEIKDPALQSKLSNIKPGQHFDVTYTEALAISVKQRTSKP